MLFDWIFSLNQFQGTTWFSLIFSFPCNSKTATTQMLKYDNIFCQPSDSHNYWLLTLVASILSNFLTNPSTRAIIWSGRVPADVHSGRQTLLTTLASLARNISLVETLTLTYLKTEFLRLCMFRRSEDYWTFRTGQRQKQL